MRVETLAEQAFFSTAYIHANDSERAWVGTGFVYTTFSGDRKPVPLLVTNKHVLEGAGKLRVRMVRGDWSEGFDKAKPLLGKATEITLRGFTKDSWVGHPDERVDVAVLPFNQILEAMLAIDAPPYFKILSSELCLTPEQADQLDALEDVVFVGYPSGIYDTHNFLPVVRRGMTATPIEVDYRGVPAFLIDASVYPGSSGSPVLLLTKGLRAMRGAAISFGSAQLILLGVLAAVHTRQVEGEVQELPARLVAEFSDPIGLGIVYKAVAIDECVNVLLQKAGLRKRST